MDQRTRTAKWVDHSEEHGTEVHLAADGVDRAKADELAAKYGTQTNGEPIDVDLSSAVHATCLPVRWIRRIWRFVDEAARRWCV
jgi:hypothetical protein